MGDNNESNMSLCDISPKLTESLLSEFLKEAHGADAEFVNYSIGSGSAKGDSYLSIVYRVVVDGVNSKDKKPLKLYLIIKGLPPCLARRKTFRSVEFFRNEVAFYTEVVPSFYAFQEKQKPTKPFKNFPRCFFGLADGENDILVLEDLSYQNYQTTGRQSGLDFEQCKVILELIGRFHAFSYAMKEKDPEELKRIALALQETYYKPEIKPWYIDQLHLFTDIAMDALHKELPDPVYEEKFGSFTDSSCYERMIEYVKPKEPNAAITHGDAWAPNFLFQCAEDDSVSEICIIDFQLARYASPALDLSFFLYSCASKDVLFNQFDDILQAYYKSLSDFVADLGSSPDALFSFKNFQAEISSYFAFGLGMSLESVPLSVVDGSELPSLETMEGDVAWPLTKIWALKPIKSKEGRLRLAGNIKHAVDKGFI